MMLSGLKWLGQSKLKPNWGLDSAVVKTFACHRCDWGSNSGVSMWQGSGRPSKVGGFPGVLRFPIPLMTTQSQHPRLREWVNKFELFV